VRHVPSTHGCPAAHTFPQAPQCFASSSSTVHSPSQATSPAQAPELTGGSPLLPLLPLLPLVPLLPLPGGAAASPPAGGPLDELLHAETSAKESALGRTKSRAFTVAQDTP
jgi:hypothetical protein